MISCELLPENELSQVGIDDAESGFGVLSTDQGRLPLKAMAVRATITGLLSQVTVQQTFVNTYAQVLEATYILPLPSRAAVTCFRMDVNGRVVDGVIAERGAARQAYEQALAAGQRAAIMEEERAEVFTVRVGNLLPGETGVVHLSLSGPLSYADGEATFRFPLVVAPRYIPGVPLVDGDVGDGSAADTDLVPDASRISPPVLLPGFPNPIQLQLEVELDPLDRPLVVVRTSLHTTVDMPGDGRIRCLRLEPGERLTRDFILRFALAAEAVRTTLVVRDDEVAGSTEGTWQLTLVPPIVASTLEKPRDVVFLLDRSGSMRGWKIMAARRAVARMVDTLSAHDRFTVLAFDSVVEQPAGCAVAALTAATDRNRFRAIEFLAGVEGRGGTEMAPPLCQAADLFASLERGRDRILVLVTDGQIGNEDHLLRLLGKRLQQVRIFALGIDRAVNAGFLERLASLGEGACELVESEERLDEALERIHRRIDHPVCTDLQLNLDGLELVPDSLVPSRFPALFAGTPLVISGRYRRRTSSGQITLKAIDSRGCTWSEMITAQATDNAALTAHWARGYIRDLEDRYVLGVPHDRRLLEQQIVDTSVRFHVLSRFTAFVAIDRAEQVVVGEGRHRVVQPVEHPDGWMMLHHALPMRALGASPMAEDSNMHAMMSVFNISDPARRDQLPELLIHGAKRVVSRKRARRLQADLAVYCRKARALLENVELYPLSVLAVELDTLIMQLEAAGTPAREIKLLRDVLQTLQLHLAGMAEDSGILQQLKDALHAFAPDSTLPLKPSPRAAKRRHFWK